MATIRTHLYGEATINPDSVTVEASAYELYDWAHRPGASWPCSTLARLDSIRATFDRGGLVGIDHPGADDVPGDEFNAWTSDVLRDVLGPGHPVWFVTVGQFERDEPGGISPEGVALGHRYVMGNVNAYCPQCTREQGVTVLDCDYDLDK
jgi:hypothetical protein